MVKLLPYTAIDGIPTFTDSFIKWLYARMQEEDSAGCVFLDGSVKTADEFLRLMKFGTVRLYVVECAGEISGVVWLNNFQSRSAEFHFCFFSSLRGKEAVAAGKEIVKELLEQTNIDGLPVFDILTGITPVTNKAAIRWGRRMGFETLGILPSAIFDAEQGESVPGQVFYVQRGTYGKG